MIFITALRHSTFHYTYIRLHGCTHNRHNRCFIVQLPMSIMSITLLLIYVCECVSVCPYLKYICLQCQSHERRMSGSGTIDAKKCSDNKTNKIINIL